jgi:hypothetical protein
VRIDDLKQAIEDSGVAARARVPDTFQLSAISAFLDFRACRFFNKFGVFN